MRAREFANDIVASATIGGAKIGLRQHALDQSGTRGVPYKTVESILRRIPELRDQIDQMHPGEEFWMYDPVTNSSTGMKMYRNDPLQLTLGTVLNDRPWGGQGPIFELKPKQITEINGTVTEVRSDDDPENNYYDDDEGFEELKVSERIQKYFTDRGYGYLGEGRDQMAFLTPRGTVLKILGIGEDQREDIVKTYVGFFMRNQRNPHYPRIYNAGDFTVDGETYFLYEMEHLNPVHGEERVLDYIEGLMRALPHGEQALETFYKNNPRPPELREEQVDGLVYATQDLEDAIGGYAPLDLSSIENLGRRDDGQIVIIDPFSL